MLKNIQTQRMVQKAMPIMVQKQNLLMLPNLALEQIIKQEIEINPFLEETDNFELDINERDDDFGDEILPSDSQEEKISTEDEYGYDDFVTDEYDGYKTKGDDETDKRLIFENIWSTDVTVRDNLITQLYLNTLTEKQYFIGAELIEFIDDEGYIRESLTELTMEINHLKEGSNFNDEEITEEEVKEILNLIKTFDPPGIASANLQECLITQIRDSNQDDEFKKLCEKVISDYIEDLRLKRYEKLIKDLGIDNEIVNKIFEFISKLNPKPGLSQESTPQDYIYPDFVIYNNEGEYKVELTDRNIPSLKVNTGYINLLKKNKHKNKETSEFIKENYEKAKWFIDAIKSRKDTMLRVMNYILKKQITFFESFGKRMEPMYERELAEELGVDISTISRTVKGKYVQTDFGIFELKHFFSNAMKTESGNDISSKEIKLKIVDIIENENKSNPFTDEELVTELGKSGYKISRRTITKYREGLKIPKARLRRKI
ncbi:MAG: RNA polymerase factor sigma-54 [Ignavibacteria bacterium]|nr:RNA polymerase factor sigma-54 [Ignavibacteria bacterium]